jgi:hypothetical protein
VRFTFAASIESKAASALHALLEQMQQLEHNGLSVCHVMGADCWRANVAKFEVRAWSRGSRETTPRTQCVGTRVLTAPAAVRMLLLCSTHSSRRLRR